MSMKRLMKSWIFSKVFFFFGRLDAVRNIRKWPQHTLCTLLAVQPRVGEVVDVISVDVSWEVQY